MSNLDTFSQHIKESITKNLIWRILLWKVLKMFLILKIFLKIVSINIGKISLYLRYIIFIIFDFFLIGIGFSFSCLAEFSGSFLTSIFSYCLSYQYWKLESFIAFNPPKLRRLCLAFSSAVCGVPWDVDTVRGHHTTGEVYRLRGRLELVRELVLTPQVLTPQATTQISWQIR